MKSSTHPVVVAFCQLLGDFIAVNNYGDRKSVDMELDRYHRVLTDNVEIDDELDSITIPCREVR